MFIVLARGLKGIVNINSCKGPSLKAIQALLITWPC